MPQSTNIVGKKFEKLDIPTLVRRMNPNNKITGDVNVQNVTTYGEVEDPNKHANILKQGTGKLI